MATNATDSLDKDRSGEESSPKKCLRPKNQFTGRRIVRAVVLFVLSTFAVAVLASCMKQSVLPHLAEHVRELLKHKAGEKEVEFIVAETVEEFPHKEERLPTDLEPLHYNLKIFVNMKALKFRGSVGIELLCTRNTSKIVLHAKDLDIGNVLVKSRNKRLVVKRIFAYDRNQQICIELQQSLIKGMRYYLQLEFKAKISDKLEGLYKSRYFEDTLR